MSLSLADISNLALTCGVADPCLLNDANFSNRNLINISQVSALTNLRSLNLSFNKITKLSALVPLYSLNVLNLMHNEIIDLQPLSHLSALTILRLSHNKAKDMSPLSSLTRLEELWMQSTPCASLSHVFAALKPLPVLHRFLQNHLPRLFFTHLQLPPGSFSNLTPRFSPSSLTTPTAHCSSALCLICKY